MTTTKIREKEGGRYEAVATILNHKVHLRSSASAEKNDNDAGRRGKRILFSCTWKEKRKKPSAVRVKR
jgi:hypothetical protein